MPDNEAIRNETDLDAPLGSISDWRDVVESYLQIGGQRCENRLSEELAETSDHHVIIQVENIGKVRADDGVQIASSSLFNVVCKSFCDSVL